MKTLKWLVFIVAGCLLTTGCVRRLPIVWTPDGSYAAVFAGDGLHLCNADGWLSTNLLPAGGLAAWFPDSTHLAVETDVGKQSWADLQKVISADENVRITRGGTTVLDGFKA